MVAVEGQLRFFVDETSLGLGLVLARARKDVVHTGHPLVPELRRGLLDTKWMPLVAARDLVVIGRDKHLRSNPAERAVMAEHALRVLRLADKKDLPVWDQLARLVRRWEDVEALLHARPTGPWFYEVQASRLREVE